LLLFVLDTPSANLNSFLPAYVPITHRRFCSQYLPRIPDLDKRQQVDVGEDRAVGEEDAAGGEEGGDGGLPGDSRGRGGAVLGGC